MSHWAESKIMNWVAKGGVQLNNIRGWQELGSLFQRSILTHKQLEMNGCILSIMATDVLVLKHQAISIHNADSICIVLDQFYIKMI